MQGRGGGLVGRRLVAGQVGGGGWQYGGKETGFKVGKWLDAGW